MQTTQTPINQLIKTLAEQLREVDNATLGLKSTYKKIEEVFPKLVCKRLQEGC